MIPGPWTDRSSKNWRRPYANHPWLWLLLIAVSVVPAAWTASQLSLKSDFKRLLPQDRPSVVTLDRIVKNVGGVGSLFIAIESEEPKASMRFIEDLVPKLRELPKKYVRYLEYNITDVRKFFTKNKYLFIDLEDLHKIHNRLARKIRYEKLKQNPFFIALEEDEVAFDVGDIEDKYRGKTSKYDAYTE